MGTPTIRLRSIKSSLPFSLPLSKGGREGGRRGSKGGGRREEGEGGKKGKEKRREGTERASEMFGKLNLICIDGFQMSIKRPTSGGQTRDQEAAVRRTFHLERSSFFYLSVLMVRTRCSTY